MTKVKILLVALFFCVLFHPDVFAAPTNIAVVPFENLNKDSSLDWLTVGIPETITVSLLTVKEISLIERTQLRKIMEEQKLQSSGMVDEKTILNIGKLAGVNVLVIGSFQKFKDTIRLAARFVDVESGKVMQTAQATGSLENIFELQDKITIGLINNLGIALKPAELAKVTEDPTKSFEAYRHFGQGTLLKEKKDYQGAAKELKAATEIDPEFSLAYEKYNEIFLSLNKGNYWTYDSTTIVMSINSEAKGIVDYKIEAPWIFKAGGKDKFNGADAFSYVMESDARDKLSASKTITSIYYQKKDDGIYYLGFEAQTTWTEGPNKGKSSAVKVIKEPPFLALPQDLYVGKKLKISNKSRFSTSGTNAVMISEEGMMEITKKETISVPAGTFECHIIKSEYESIQSGNKTLWTQLIWFAPGVGMVKIRVETVDSNNKTITDQILREYHIEL